MNQSYFGNGQFEFIRERGDRELYINMHGAITQTELWNWMRCYKPDPSLGFMWSNTPEIQRINNKMSEDPISGNHSGSSYGAMMRDMEVIAKNGYEEFKRRKMHYYNNPTPEQRRRAGIIQAIRNEILAEQRQEQRTQSSEEQKEGQSTQTNVYALYPPQPPHNQNEETQ
jgi:hypothetical protein